MTGVPFLCHCDICDEKPPTCPVCATRTVEPDCLGLCEACYLKPDADWTHHARCNEFGCDLDCEIRRAGHAVPVPDTHGEREVLR